MMDTPNDLCGFPISVGVYMVQAYNEGRSASLKFARVVSIKDGKIRVVGCERFDVPEYLGNSTNAKLRWVEKWRKTNPTTLTFSNRTIVVGKEGIPAHILEVLDGENA